MQGREERSGIKPVSINQITPIHAHSHYSATLDHHPLNSNHLGRPHLFLILEMSRRLAPHRLWVPHYLSRILGSLVFSFWALFHVPSADGGLGFELEGLEKYKVGN